MLRVSFIELDAISFIKKTQRFEDALYWANEIRICDLTLWNRSRIFSC